MTSSAWHWARRILACVLPPRDLEAVMGDLVEECALRSDSVSPSHANRWLWGQIARSVPPLLWALVRQGGWPTTLAVAIGACLVQAAVELTGKAAIAGLAGGDMRIVALLSWVVGFPSLVLVSYFAARIRPGAAIALTGIIVVAVVVQLVLKAQDLPAWKQIVALVVGPLGAFAGGAMSLRRNA